MDFKNKFVERLIELRNQKGISARDMSISLGQSESYINKIENNKSLPSLTGFFYICEYFNITPKEFFDFDVNSPELTNEFIFLVKILSYSETNHLIEVVKDINKKK